MSFGPKLEYISLMHLQKDDMRDDLNDKNITVSGQFIELQEHQLGKQRRKSSNNLVFNEDLIICRFKQNSPPTEIQQQVERFRHKDQYQWVNPSKFSSDQVKLSTDSILKKK